MRLMGPAQRLRVYLGEGDRPEGSPAAEAVVLQARRAGLAGATVLRGILGFGASGRIHTESLVEVEGDLPLRVELVDATERIDGFLPALGALPAGGTAVVEDVLVVHYRHRAAAGGAAADPVGTSAPSPKGVPDAGSRMQGGLGMDGAVGRRLCVYFGERDRFEGRDLATAMVLAARRTGLAGATVLRGILGFGAHSRVHALRPFTLSQDLPLMVEIVDLPERIDAFLPQVDRMLQGGLVTVEDTRIVLHRPAFPTSGASAGPKPER